MSLVAYGEHHGPAQPVDPAEYPHKLMMQGDDDDAPTVIAWLDRHPLPFDDDFADVLRSTVARGGHVLLMARDAAVLERAVAAVLFLVDPAAVQ